jgi:WD40 repeat protein
MTMSIRLRLLLALILLAGISSMTHAQSDNWYWEGSLGESRALAAVWHPSQDIFAIGSDTEVRFYDITPREIGAIPSDGFTDLAWSPDGDWLAVAEENIVRVWQVSDMTAPSLDYSISNAVAPVAWSPDSEHLAYSTRGGVIRVWERATGRSTVVFDGHVADPTDDSNQSDVFAMIWTADGTAIVSVSSIMLAVWDAATGDAIQEI